ncbi:MAG: galactokinase [Oscillospiraceae bacterium]|nr:galactokinase [Oscillospiraceae bacterium]
MTVSENTLEKLYGANAVSMQKSRYEAALKSFEEIYGKQDNIRLFSAPGRTEVGGNHTDHNRGCVMAAAVGLDVIAVVSPCEGNVISVKSEGFPEDVVDISDLSVKENEKNSSASLIRGVAAGFKNAGLKVCGFKAYTTSNVLKGSGLSSSAAFEVLIGTIFSYLCNEGSVSAVKIAQIAQYAENVYFGKPSGLMDQMASSVGGFITIDFKDTKDPIIDAISYDFASSGYTLCIVDTKGNHADLTPEYAAIPAEMKSVAKFFGKSELRDITKKQLLDNIAEVRKACGDRAVARAFHFFDDNERVGKEAAALRSGDIDGFLKLVSESGNSSFKYLQNVFAVKNPSEQGLVMGLYISEDLLRGRGAVRVHGGGFAGTIQAFVPHDLLDTYSEAMEKVFGKGSCYKLYIRPVGGTEVK